MGSNKSQIEQSIGANGVSPYVGFKGFPLIPY